MSKINLSVSIIKLTGIIETIEISISDIIHFPNNPDQDEVVQKYMEFNYPNCKYSYVEIDRYVELDSDNIGYDE